MNDKITIIVRRLNYVVKLPSMQYKYLIETMLVRLSTYSFKWDYKKKRNVRLRDKIFATEDNMRMEYRFNINTLKNFMLLLGNNYISKDKLNIVFEKECYPAKLNCDLAEHITTRDYQNDYIDLLLKGKDTKPYMLVDLFTGYGKTTLSMAAITTIKQRTMILVLPKYIDKWISDVKANTTVKDKDIYVVKGGDSLNKLILAIEQGATYDFIIVGIRTIYNYIKSYETRLYDSEFSYERTPDELMEALGVGVILNDETHQEFHAVYKCCLYFNPCRFIGLSATLDNNDKNLVRMYDTMFPKDCRISGLVEYKHYVESYNIAYRIRNTKRIQYQRQQGYNHTLLEASIMRNSVLLKDYVNMITYYVKEGYYKRREEGDKALIFVASVKFATLLKQHMEVIFEDIDVRRYVEDDPYENLMDGDLIISTPNSAGVAVDIPGLISVYQTVAIKSLQMNKQTFGRLRNLKGKEMRYYSFYCKDIPKHKDMIRVRKEILLPFSKHWYEDEYSKTLEVV